MKPHERLELSRGKITRLLDSSISGIISYANMEHLILSGDAWKRLRRPPAAAHAFSALQQDVMQFEVIKLCRYWEKVDLDGYSLPTVVYLLNTDAVKLELAAQHPMLQRDVDYHQQLLVRKYVECSISSIDRIVKSNALANVFNLRQKFAHNLVKTNAEKSAVFRTPKVKGVARLLRLTAINIEWLNRGVRGSDFDWASSLQTARREAAAFWDGP